MQLFKKCFDSVLFLKKIFLFKTYMKTQYLKFKFMIINSLKTEFGGIWGGRGVRIN